MFTFISLQGAQSESTAVQSLLELDGGVKVLIDVGWDEEFDTAKLQELEKQVPTISLVLLTHATVSHIAAFAHCCKNFPQFARIPVFATKPVIDLGRTLLQDLYASTPRAATTIPRSSLTEASYSYAQTLSAEHTRFLLPPPTADEITRYFSLIRELKYSQPHQPTAPANRPPLSGLTITAYNAGRTLGGTIWHLQHGAESVVYGVDWGQYKENVFAGAAWLGGRGGSSASDVLEQLHKPTALVSSSRAPHVLRPGLRDDQLLATIRSGVAAGGTVLIPVDSSARVLELAYLLEHAWRREAAEGNSSNNSNNNGSLAAAKLYLAGRTSGSLVRHARTLLEWMNDGIVQEFEAVADGSKQATGGRGGRGGGGGDDARSKAAGPFDFRHLRLLERRAQVDKVMSGGNANGSSGGKVILASDASLEWGFSKEVLRSMAEDPRNLVILTEVPGALSAGKTSLARTLWEWWRDGSGGSTDGVIVPGSGRPLTFEDAKRVALDNDEMSLYQQWLATQRQLHATLQTGGVGGIGVGTGDKGTSGDGLGDGGLVASLDALAGGVDDDDDDNNSSSSSDSEESDGERQGKVLNISTTMGQASRKKVVLRDEDLGVTILIKRKGHYDFDVRGKKGRERIFPLAVRRRRNDDFGELIRPEEYLREEEREEENSSSALQQQQQQSLQDNLGKKRKWDDVGVAGGPGKDALGARRRGNGREADMMGTGPGGRGGGPENGSRDRDFKVNGGGGDDNGYDPDDDGLDDVQDKEEPAVVTGPAKLEVSTQTVAARLSIAYVDFSGLHTDRNLEMLLPLVEPRKLILVGGSAAETEAAAARYRAVVSKNRGVAPGDVDVLLPTLGASVDASVDTHAWMVRLTDALVKKLKWQNLRDLGLVTLTGRLLPGVTGGGTDDSSDAAATTTAAATAVVPGDANKRQKMNSGAVTVLAVAGVDNAAALPSLDVLSVPALRRRQQQRQRKHAGAQPPLHVGELRLADLRRAMQVSGHTAEFRGEGTLVIDGSVAVRKTSTGRVEVESIGLATDGGPATKVGGTFYAVKRMIYERLAVVSGG